MRVKDLLKIMDKDLKIKFVLIECDNVTTVTRSCNEWIECERYCDREVKSYTYL